MKAKRVDVGVAVVGHEQAIQRHRASSLGVEDVGQALLAAEENDGDFVRLVADTF
jgi:hypothetical protein